MTPWAAIGISRATWYRHGKPDTKPQRMTQARVRTIQRAARVKRDAPKLVPLIAARKMSVGYAEKLIRTNGRAK